MAGGVSTPNTFVQKEEGIKDQVVCKMPKNDLF